MIKDRLVSLKKREINSIRLIGLELMPKPVIPILVIFFPFLLVGYFFEMKVYSQKLDLFIKGTFYTRQLVFDAIENGLSEKEAFDFIKEKIFSKSIDEKFYMFFEQQFVEAKIIFINFYKYINEPKYFIEYDKIIENEISTIKIASDVFNMNDEEIATSLKLQTILKSKMTRQ